MSEDPATVHILYEEIKELRQRLAEKERLCEKLTIDRKAAADLEQAKADFMANMSHELRTPLNGVLGMCEVLLTTVLSEDQKTYFDIVHKSAFALQQIVDDILEYSTMSSGELKLVPIEFNVREHLEALCNGIHYHAEQRGLELVLHIADSVPEKLVADPIRLSQIVVNLVDNAIKFSGDRGGILIYVSANSHDETGVVLNFAITDSGPGIPREKRQEIFDAFTQVDTSSTRRYGGTGIGLSICAQLVRLMHGDIWLESKQWMGSAFHFYVKCELSGEEVEQSSDLIGVHTDSGRFLLRACTVESKLVEPDPRKISILVAEDNELNQRLAIALLEFLGHEVTVASDGSEAVSLISKREFDLILMDCQMPGVDGYEATSIIRDIESTRGFKVPIVAMTAGAMPGERERCLLAGMDHYVAKPISKENIKEIINHFVTAKSQG